MLCLMLDEMGRRKGEPDEAELQDILAMRTDVLDNQKETASLHLDVTALQTEVCALGHKQNLMTAAVDGVQKYVTDIGLQLLVMSEALQSLRPGVAPTKKDKNKTVIPEFSKSPTLQDIQTQAERNASFVISWTKRRN